MRLLFVNTVDTHNYSEVMFPPLGLAYIASYLRQYFPGIEIKIVYENVDNEVSSFRPDMLCISSVTQNYNLAKGYAAAGQRNGLPVIIGGTHITSLPSTMTDDMDLAVIGEGEETMREIIVSLQDGKAGLESCRHLPGVAYKDGGRIKVNPPRAEITPLDTIPFPARDLLPIPKKGIIHLFSSRGCPYNCQFCASARFWSKLRFFSADYVMEELDRVVEEYSPITVGFYDDLFIASRKRLHEIAERIVARGYNKKVEFVLNGRANLITDEMAALFKRMNVVAVNMGIESGSAKMLSFLKGNSVTVETNFRAVETLYRHGINSHGTFVIGCPNETEEDILDTERFIRKSKLSSFEVYILTPYPGTPIWTMAMQKGRVSNDMDWSRLIQEGVDPNKVLMTDRIDPQTLYRCYMRLQRLKKRRRINTRILTALRNPGRIIPAIRKNYLSKWMHRLTGI